MHALGNKLHSKERDFIPFQFQLPKHSIGKTKKWVLFQVRVDHTFSKGNKGYQILGHYLFIITIQILITFGCTLILRIKMKTDEQVKSDSSH